MIKNGRCSFLSNDCIYTLQAARRRCIQLLLYWSSLTSQKRPSSVKHPKLARSWQSQILATPEHNFRALIFHIYVSFLNEVEELCRFHRKDHSNSLIIMCDRDLPLTTDPLSPIDRSHSMSTGLLHWRSDTSLWLGWVHLLLSC